MGNPTINCNKVCNSLYRVYGSLYNYTSFSLGQSLTLGSQWASFIVKTILLLYLTI